MRKIMSIFLMLMICVMSVGSVSRGGSRVELPSKVHGLENAILRVKNESVAVHLEEVLVKVQEKWRERFANMTDLIVEVSDNDSVVVVGKKTAKFLGVFRLMHRYRYQVGEDGQVVRKKFWFDWLWKDEVNKDG